MKFYRAWLIMLCLLGLGFAPLYRVAAQAAPLADQLHALAAEAKEGIEAAEKGDSTAMQTIFKETDKAWETFEDAIRQQNPTGYVEIEAALDGVKDAVQATPLDAGVARQAYDHLMDEANGLADHIGQAPTAPQSTVDTAATLTQLRETVDQTYAAIKAGNSAEASTQLAQAVQLWPSVEGTIATKSQDAYTAIEGDLGRATAALREQPANLTSADHIVAHLQQTLTPFAEVQTYSAFDAAAIILREGLEALLVIVALLTFLQRSNNRDKNKWIWGGAGAGVLISIGSAFLLQMVFSRVSAGQNRELIEGITGLVAALLLFYVSYWLHSKASLRAWQSYINVRTTQVLARGSMFGLALLAFLAVFREGAETTIFYLGMALAITARDLWLGLALGCIALVIAAFLILVVGVRLPLRLFFRVAGLLVYYLGFKFVGAGLHALQVAGMLPISPVAFLREIPFLGFYPTLETIIPQFLLLVGALFVVFYLRNLDRQAQVASTAPV